MNSIELIAVIGALIGFSFFKGHRIYAAIMGVIVGCFFGYLMGIGFGCIVPRVDVRYGTEQLVSMRTTDGTTGTFLLGSGSIGLSSAYNFLIVDEGGTFSPRSVTADSIVHIQQDPTLHGVGYWTSTVRKPDERSPYYRWAILFDAEQVVRQDFRVPVGSVLQQFKVQ